jgi:hypothetical protein
LKAAICEVDESVCWVMNLWLDTRGGSGWGFRAAAVDAVIAEHVAASAAAHVSLRQLLVAGIVDPFEWLTSSPATD